MDARFLQRENLRSKFSYESENPRMDFRFDSHHGGSTPKLLTKLRCKTKKSPALAEDSK